MVLSAAAGCLDSSAAVVVVVAATVVVLALACAGGEWCIVTTASAARKTGGSDDVFSDGTRALGVPSPTRCLLFFSCCGESRGGLLMLTLRACVHQDTLKKKLHIYSVVEIKARA